MWWLLTILFFIVSVVSSTLLFYSLRRITQYEEFILEIQQVIKFSTDKMKLVDSKGHYESDDETGFFFEQLKQIQLSLDGIFEEETQDAKKKVNDVKAEIKKIVKKKKRKVYFGQEVQDAVVDYNSSTDDSERNQIYGTRIHAAFDKLAENIINTFKFTYFDDPFVDVKHEVVTFMVMNMHKYDHTKGSKAFSYFSVVAKNYLILHNNNNYKKFKTHDKMEVLDRHRGTDTQGESDVVTLTNEIIEYFDSNMNTIFKKNRDLRIGYAIIDLMKARDDIENFNKKAIYILIREMTDVETAHITSVVNVLKKHYKKLLNVYHKSGTIVHNFSGSFF